VLREVPRSLLDWKPWHWLTVKLRPLPSFLFAGVGKSGTTSLYAYLAQHPQTIPCRKKAPHFFNKRYKKGVNWYRMQFPVVTPRFWCRLTNSKPSLVFEASDSYFTSPEVPERVAQLMPWVRVAVILRSPVDRAVSHYQHNVRRKRETLSFAESIDWEMEQITASAPTYTSNRDRNTFHFAYLGRGRYAEHLRNWLEFFPLERLKIIKAEDYYADPRVVFADVLKFLELSPWEPKQFEVQNAGGGYPKISPSMNERLREYFQPYNRELYQIIGRDFEW
jgi:hypothetical protein